MAKEFRGHTVMQSEMYAQWLRDKRTQRSLSGEGNREMLHSANCPAGNDDVSVSLALLSHCKLLEIDSVRSILAFRMLGQEGLGSLLATGADRAWKQSLDVVACRGRWRETESILWNA